MREESFGIVPLERRGNAWVALCILHRKGNHWSFPKGHADAAEGAIQAAERELDEETGLKVVRYLPFDPLHETYSFEREGKTIEKLVTYHVAEVAGVLSPQVDEIASAEWLPIPDAEARMTFPEGRELVRKVALLLEKHEVAL